MTIYLTPEELYPVYTPTRDESYAKSVPHIAVEEDHPLYEEVQEYVEALEKVRVMNTNIMRMFEEVKPEPRSQTAAPEEEGLLGYSPEELDAMMEVS